jgi:hypothetical protein
VFHSVVPTEGAAAESCRDGFAKFGTPYAQKCQKSLRCTRDPRVNPPCADDVRQRQCRSALQACIVTTNNAFCDCFSAFLDCVPSGCTEWFKDDCIKSGCASAQCKNATLPSTMPFCGQYCARLCPSGVDTCECPEGRMEPVKFECKTATPGPTPKPKVDGPINSGVEWIDVNWQLFIGLMCLGGVCYCLIYIGLLCVCWKCLPDADEEEEKAANWDSNQYNDDDLDYNGK